MRNHLLSILVIFISLSLISCDKEENTQPDPDTEIVNELNDKTIIINSETELLLVEVNESSLVFSSNINQVSEFEVGSILVSDMSNNAPNGYLRKIISIDENEGNIIVNTLQASLVDAIKSTDFETNYRIDNSDVIGTDFSEIDINDEKSIKNPENTSITFSLNNEVLFDEDGDTNTTHDQITLDGEVSIEFDVDFRLKIRQSRVKEFELVQHLTSSLEASVGLDIEVANLEEEFILLTHQLAPFTIIIPPGFPLVITQELVISVGVDGSINIGVTYGATNTSTASYGILYNDDSGWNTIQSNNNNLEYDTLEFYFKGVIEPWLQASYDIRLYGLPPKISLFVKPSIKLSGETNLDNPTFIDANLDWCVDVGAKAKLVIFDNAIVEFNQHFYHECFFLTDWSTESGTSGSIPIVTTESITDITQTSATSGGNVTDDGGFNVTARGVCWSTNPDPTTANSNTNDGTGVGGFTSSLTGLTENTTYYVRAYAVNNEGTGYGEELEFTTLESGSIPTISTSTIIVTSPTSVISGGYLIENNGNEITAKGVCWSTLANPTTSDDITNDGTGSVPFASIVEGLDENTTYYLKAYATNSEGTGYGNELSFTTQDSGSGGVYDGNVTLLTQQEVNDFGANNYTSVTGNIEIWGSSFSTSDPILDLNPLSSLTSVGGSLEFVDSEIDLNSFQGLNNIESIGGTLQIICNNVNDLSPFGNLVTVGGQLRLQNGFNITSLNGFSNLQSIGSQLLIEDFDLLINLNELANLDISATNRISISNNNNLQDISGIFNNVNSNMDIIGIGYNDSLPNLDFLSNITIINNGLGIYYNSLITNLDGLNNLSFVGSYLHIQYNDTLLDFCGLTLLMNNGFSNEYVVNNNAYNPTIQDIIDGNCSQ